MFALTGKMHRGLGAGAPCLALQLPLIAAGFPEVAACHPATINIEFPLPLLVFAGDHRTRPIAWSPLEDVTEVFDLVRMTLEAPPGAAAVPAWLYVPHGSPHRRTPQIHEVIAPRLNLEGVTECRVNIDRPALQLPWHEFPAVMLL